MVKGKIQSRNQELNNKIHSAFYRYLLVYYLTPLLAAGAITKVEIMDFEAQLMKKQLLLPNNVRNKVVLNVCSDSSKSVADTCFNLARHQRMFVRKDKRAPLKKNLVIPSIGRYGISQLSA